MSIILPKQNEKNKKTIHYTLANSKNLLLIFTRNPELGKCKTRLAATVGDNTALEVYKFLLEHTVKITKNLNATKQVWYSETIWKDDVWDETFFSKQLQQGANLGERMDNAFQAGFELGFKKIIIIGSDMYDLNTADLEHAFAQLDDHDYVLGPAEDGGYYLLGMKQYSEALFKNKEWGKDTVLQDTLTDLKNEKYTLLETKNDIDVYEDLQDIDAFQPFIKDLKL